MLVSSHRRPLDPPARFCWGPASAPSSGCCSNYCREHLDGLFYFPVSRPLPCGSSSCGPQSCCRTWWHKTRVISPLLPVFVLLVTPLSSFSPSPCCRPLDFLHDLDGLRGLSRQTGCWSFFFSFVLLISFCDSPVIDRPSPELALLFFLSCRIRDLKRQLSSHTTPGNPSPIFLRPAPPTLRSTKRYSELGNWA